MENVVLVIHLLLALALIIVVLMQRSEGGGLGIGGGGGGAMTGRSAATALAKVTWGLAIAFICTSIALTVLARSGAGSSSVIGGGTPATGTTGTGLGGNLLPPGSGDQPLTPPRVD